MLAKVLGQLIGQLLAIPIRAVVTTCIHSPYGAVGALLWLGIQILFPWLWNPPLWTVTPTWWLVLSIGMLTFGFMSEYVWRPLYRELTDAV